MAGAHTHKELAGATLLEFWMKILKRGQSYSLEGGAIIQKGDEAREAPFHFDPRGQALILSS